jgi:hypothetical protein
MNIFHLSAAAFAELPRGLGWRSTLRTINDRLHLLRYFDERLPTRAAKGDRVRIIDLACLTPLHDDYCSISGFRRASLPSLLMADSRGQRTGARPQEILLHLFF